MHEVAALTLHADMLHFTIELKVIIGLKRAVPEIVLRLLMHKRTNLTGHQSDALPLLQ